ncbi:MAG TPA: hypothetical protein VFV46_12860 [Lacibacter sp.]|nr:hypothetical protein [Lacibacter sp.]
MKQILLLAAGLFFAFSVSAQEKTDSVIVPDADTILRIRNLNPYFTLHVDSSLSYKLEINKEESKYYWYLKNSLLGLRINKDNGLLTFKAEKAYFLSGKLKYDTEYKVMLGVQNLFNPSERADTAFTIVFFNTEVVTSKARPSVSGIITVDEGDTLRFRIGCENGNFPVEFINFESSLPLKTESSITKCGDEFRWGIPYDFVKDNDTLKTKSVRLLFIATDKFRNRDTAIVRINVRDALNYPQKKMEYEKTVSDYNRYIQQLKFTFRSLDKKIKKVRGSRIAFDMTSSSSALAGTILSTSANESQKNVGRVLPAVGVTLVPVKEAVAPNKVNEQNMVSQVRSSIRRLEFVLSENSLIGEKDMEIVQKTARLKAELKQSQLQLIDVPLEGIDILDPLQANQYFNDPKVNKKYNRRKK